MHISLDGQWLLSHCPAGSGTLAQSISLPTLPYTVPGDIHTPFIEHGLIPEPLVGMGDQQCRWLENEEFWCRKQFCLTKEEMCRQMTLTFDGLDCTADIYLNGQYVGSSNNSFVESSFDVGRFLQPGSNLLTVRIDQGLEAVKNQPLRGMERMWNNDQPYRALMRKPQYVYGWDWTLWLPSCGIWKSVHLEGHDHPWLSNVHAWTQGALCENGEARVNVAWETALAGQADCIAHCCIRDADGRTVAEGRGDAGQMALVIPQARLWWCNGLGEPYLYTLTVTLLDGQGQTLHALEQRLGLRTIALREEPLNAEESGFTFLLNGVPVFCKGANITPGDCLVARVKEEQTVRTVQLAREAHMNMLRVWGGGVYASDCFLEACDRAGIMVWHDFMFACGYHPDDDPCYMANVEREATLAIRRMRIHPCLIGWAGNNEIQEMYEGQRRWIPDLPFYGGTIYTRLLPGLVSALHPGAVYRESSPLGGEDPADIRRGDQHIWHFTHRPGDPLYLDLWRFTDFRAKFLSEFGVIGAMSLESARKSIGPEHLDPDDPVWLHHTNSGQDHTLLNLFVDKYFGGHRDISVQQYILRSQAIQAEMVRHIYDEFRARKFECSGLLFWTLGDSFGIHNWSLIDYYLQKKPAYYALQRSMSPVALCIRGYEVQTTRGMAEYRDYWAKNEAVLEILGMNDTLSPQQGELRWRLMTRKGEILSRGSRTCVLPPNGVVGLADVPVVQVEPDETLLHAAFYINGECVNENRYFLAPFAKMACPDAAPQCVPEPLDSRHIRLRLYSDAYVWMLHLETPDGVELSDNDFDLFPGEERSVIVEVDGEGYVPRFHWIGEKDGMPEGDTAGDGC